MGKKRKEDKEGNETYEVWIYKTDGNWTQVVERGNDGIFEQKTRALLIAGSKSTQEGVVETLVIERHPIASFNGPAIAIKGRLRSVGGQEKKKELGNADVVHGGRPEKGQVPPSGAGQPGEAGVPRLAGKADPS